MIIVSGLLVAVALALLVVGLQVSLGYVYASIGVSVLAFLLLGLAARQRRTAAPLAAPSAAAAAPPALVPDEDDGPTYGDPEPSSWRAVPEPAPGAYDDDLALDLDRDPAPVEDDDDLLEDEDLLGGAAYGGTVLVVPGRPRYHVAGCRYLLGKESAELDVLDAREEGFRPCGICSPDLALADEAVESSLVQDLREQRRDAVDLRTQPEADPLDLLDLDEDEDEDDDQDDAPPAEAGPVLTRRRSAGSQVVAQAPVDDVVLVPERGRYHRPTCRYARGEATARAVSPGRARAEGALPCGICRP